MRCWLNRTCHQLWEKAYKRGKADQVATRIQTAAENFNALTDSLKGVKTDTNRQYDVQRREVGIYANRCKQRREAVGKEVKVFEEPQYD